jgi:hypothetical protein
MVLNHTTTTAAASASFFKPVPPVNDSSNMNDTDASQIQMALDQILADFQKGSNSGNNMMQISQDSATTQERALKALLIDRDNQVRQQREASFVNQEQLLHQILFSSQQQAAQPKQTTSQFETFPPPQKNWWLYPPPNYQITNGLKQQGNAYRSTIPKANLVKQSTKENYFSPMPAVSKVQQHKASRIFRSIPDETSTPKRVPGLQFRTSRRLSDEAKSKNEDDKSSSDVTSDDSSMSTDSYQTAFYIQSPVSKFRPLLPEAPKPANYSRSAGAEASGNQSKSKETDLIMRIIVGSYEEIQQIINEFKNGQKKLIS